MSVWIYRGTGPVAAPALGPVLPLPVLRVVRRPQDSVYVTRVKPCVDVLLTVVLVMVTAPVMAVVASAVLLSLGRPVLFRQQRVGRRGRPFAVLKFRTMHPDRRTAAVPVAVDRRVTHKSGSDPRHTSVGRLLRALSLDELPQLINVLRGEMSLVGPRPELVHVVSSYASWQHERHAVRPGLTGPWQVSARGAGRMDEFTHLDVEYVRHVSFLTDLRILAMTGPALFRRRGE